jgi:hypothetical protein
MEEKHAQLLNAMRRELSKGRAITYVAGAASWIWAICRKLPLGFIVVLGHYQDIADRGCA